MNEDRTNSKPSVEVPQELRWFLYISVSLWLLSILFMEFGLHFHLRNPGLPVVFTYIPFTDLNVFTNILPKVHRPEFFTAGFSYPAPCFFLLSFFLHFNTYSHHSQRFGDIAYVCTVAAGLLLLVGNMVPALTRRGLSRTDSWLLLLATGLVSYPIMLAVRVGNIEAVLWIGVAIAAAAYYHRLWWTAAILIGVVGAFKIYPLLLLGLFISPRKYWQFAVGLLTFAAVTVASLAYIGPTLPFAYHHVTSGVNHYNDLGLFPGMIDRRYLAFDHSIVSLIRVCTWHFPRVMAFLFHFYMPVAGLSAALLFFNRIWKMPRLNQLFFIILAAVMLPAQSYDYTLQMLYIPWAWLALLAVSAAARGEKVAGMMPIMVCLALLCSPEFFIKFHAPVYGQFKTIILIALVWLVAKYPLCRRDAVPLLKPTRYDNDSPSCTGTNSGIK